MKRALKHAAHAHEWDASKKHHHQQQQNIRSESYERLHKYTNAIVVYARARVCVYASHPNHFRYLSTVVWFCFIVFSHLLLVRIVCLPFSWLFVVAAENNNNNSATTSTMSTVLCRSHLVFPCCCPTLRRCAVVVYLQNRAATRERARLTCTTALCCCFQYDVAVAFAFTACFLR